MASLGAMRSGLAARLATITGLQASAVWPASINPPAAIVRPVSEATQDMTLAGGDAPVRFEIVVLVSMASLEQAQTDLDAYLSQSGASSIEAAILADDTLGGIVSYCLTQGWRDYGLHVINGAEALGALLDVEVQI